MILLAFIYFLLSDNKQRLYFKVRRSWRAPVIMHEGIKSPEVSDDDNLKRTQKVRLVTLGKLICSNDSYDAFLNVYDGCERYCNVCYQLAVRM